MKLFRIFSLICLFTLSQHAFALSETDENSIKEIIQHYVDAWNHHAGKGFTDHYTENSDFINIFGGHYHGKKEIQQRHDHILSTFLKDSIFTITNLELREVNPKLVMAFVRWNVEGFQNPETECHGAGEPVIGIFSHVFIKDSGSWEITSTQNTITSCNE